jgi:23S rRNA pseudouridine2605 synthase
MRPRSAHHARRGPRPHRGQGPSAEEPQRLQKVLAQAGLGSRREIEDWIRAGRITVNGEIAVLGARALGSDRVRLDGRLVRQRAPGGGSHIFLCHRSPGESLRTPHGAADAPALEGPSAARPALMDRLPRRAGRRYIAISPMPRVDGGLELVTSDGALASRVQRRVRDLSSAFSVRVRGELTEEQRQRVLAGELDSGEKLQVESCEAGGGEGSNRWYALIARGASGKEVRQLFERNGALVSRVLRTHLGPLTLERALGRGAFRELTAQELAALSAAEAQE